MTALKPVYSRPSDDEDTLRTRYRKCRRCRKFRKDVRTTDTPSAAVRDDAKGIAKHDTPSHSAREDDGVVNRDPIAADANVVVKRHPTTDDHHERNRRTRRRKKRRLDDLRAENERLHRRLAAVYDALSLD